MNMRETAALKQLQKITPSIALNLLKTLHAAEKVLELDAADEAALEILRQLLVAWGTQQEPTPASRPWEEIATQDMGLQVLRPSSHHIQFRQDGVVLADWWPSKGTTMSENRRGPVCKTGDEVIAWLKNL